MTSSSECFNPCCNGRYSQSRREPQHRQNLLVLILAVMEDTLKGYVKFHYWEKGVHVLILVVMEDTLKEQKYHRAICQSFTSHSWTSIIK